MLTVALLGAMFSQKPVESIRVDLSRKAVPVSRSLFGIFFEEINNAGEGGLYGELLMNRAMVPGDGRLPEGWQSTTANFDAKVSVNDSQAGSIHLDGTSADARLRNTGFWGISTKKGQKANLRVWVKGNGRATVGLVAPDGTSVSNSKQLEVKPGWNEFKTQLTFSKDTPGAQFEFHVPKGSNVWVGYASLMPADTYKARTNGLRQDLAKKLEAMQPGFLRFPGGCYVEGQSLGNCFPWKETIQPIEYRKPTPRTFWGYVSSNGLGYHEYLQMCEDFGSEPMFVINCGMSHSEITPMNQMQSWVQDALDAIEYANGAVTTAMGALRAKNGHPKSFNLKYIEIGNENGYSWAFGGAAPYYERFDLINKAIKSKHPEILTISNVPVPRPGDLVSEHYYSDPAFFWNNKDRYDAYDRKGTKVYVGEYAVTQQNGRGSLAGALAEAAFMTGMERNADVVAMASYAPLFENINRRQWNPNAIVFDGSRSYGTPSYWVQEMFAKNRVDTMVPYQVSADMGDPPSNAGRFGLKTWQTQATFKNLKLVVEGKVAYEKSNPRVEDFDGLQGEWVNGPEGLSQTRIADDQMAFLKGVTTGDGEDWTFEFDAKIDGGSEAFMPLYAVQGRNQHVQWNIGGWRNTIHAFQRNGARFGKGVEGEIAKGVWVHVQLTKQGAQVSGYLDGKLIESVVESGTPNFAASTGVSLTSKELVLKLVNGATKARTIALGGLPVQANQYWKAVELSSARLEDENTLDRPNNISPQAVRFKAGKEITVKPLSLTIVRIPVPESVIQRLRVQGMDR